MKAGLLVVPEATALGQAALVQLDSRYDFNDIAAARWRGSASTPLPQRSPVKLPIACLAVNQ